MSESSVLVPKAAVFVTTVRTAEFGLVAASAAVFVTVPFRKALLSAKVMSVPAEFQVLAKFTVPLLLRPSTTILAALLRRAAPSITKSALLIKLLSITKIPLLPTATSPADSAACRPSTYRQC